MSPKPKPYDEDLAAELCERIAQGEAFNAICDNPRFPSTWTVRRWMAVESSFALAYARAREAQMEKWSDDVVEIADDASNDYIERTGKDGEVERVLDPEAVQRSKLRIDTRKWLMSKLAAKTYGDKVDVNLSGAVEISTLSDEELESRTRARLVALGVEVAAPLLLPMPGAAPLPGRALPPVVTVPDEPLHPPSGSASTGAGAVTEPARKRSANDLLGLGPAA